MLKNYFVKKNETDDIEYVIVHAEESDRFILKRSNSHLWSEDCRGEVLLDIFNTGDGFKFHDRQHLHINTKRNAIGYSDWFHLHLLMSFIQSKQLKINTHTVFSWEEVITVE